MIACIFWGLVNNENDEYNVKFHNSFPAFFVIIPCNIALHLKVFPEIAAGMKIMKFANN